MASFRFLLVLVLSLVFTHGRIAASLVHNGWELGRATFYGDARGGETMEGACGYKNDVMGYGLETTALSSALFNDGAACGQCYVIMCVNNRQFCNRGKRIRVTATNLCPPDYTKTHDIWCNPPQKHFDLSQPMFTKIAQYRAGVVPVAFRRVNCVRSGGLRFKITGNPYFMLVLVFNVGGAGDVSSMRVKGSGGWISMRRNWGQNWQIGERMQGQSLSFEVTISNGHTIQAYNVAPANWQFEQTYLAKQNFH